MCKTCDGAASTDCLDCVTDAQKLSSGACECKPKTVNGAIKSTYYNPNSKSCVAIPDCAEGTYLYENRTNTTSDSFVYDCAPCHKSCKACSGGKSENCIKGKTQACANDSLTFNAASTTSTTGKCDCSGSAKKYYDEKQNSCLNCQTSCTTCSNGSSCITCDEANGYTARSTITGSTELYCTCNKENGYFLT
jgi:hypothetical protein